jgi:hypothetical protein
MIVPWIDIATAAWEAGFRGDDMAIAIALSQPESQRNNDAVNHEDPNGGSFGLLQINGVHDPNATGVYPNLVPTQAWIDKMFQPKENYKAAFTVYSRAGKTFNPWGTYTNGAYLLKWHDPVDVAKVAMDGRQRIATVQMRLDSSQATLATTKTSLSTALAELTKVTQQRDQAIIELASTKRLLEDEQAKTAEQAAQIAALLGKIDNAKSALA